MNFQPAAVKTYSFFKSEVFDAPPGRSSVRNAQAAFTSVGNSLANS